MPNCPLSAKHCGGCPLLATPYTRQLQDKQAKVESLLGKFGTVLPIIGQVDPWHYRNKAVASFANGARNKLVCGTYMAGSHRVLPAVNCLLQAEVLNKTITAANAAANACHYTAFDEDRGTGLVRHILVRSAHATGQVMAVLVTGQAVLPGARNFAVALRKNAPWVTTVVQNYNPRQTSTVLGVAEKLIYGPGRILDTLCGLQFAISPRSFYQVNSVQTELLYKKALQFACLTGSETVLDAYCGIGTIGLCAAAQAGEVIGVERNPDAVRDAIANARRNKISNASFQCADATEWMRTAAAQGQRPDVAFLDPPREGSTPEFITALTRLKPDRIVYISCNPETLARDLTIFTQKSYRPKKIQPVDMFPHTDHVESVVLMSRVDK